MIPSLGDMEGRNTFGPARWSMTAGFTTISNTAPAVVFTVISTARISGSLILVAGNDLKHVIAVVKNTPSLGIS